MSFDNPNIIDCYKCNGRAEKISYEITNNWFVYICKKCREHLHVKGRRDKSSNPQMKEVNQ